MTLTVRFLVCWIVTLVAGCADRVSDSVDVTGDGDGDGDGAMADGDGDNVGAPCDRDEDCDDAEFCNGQESCDPTTGCAAGVAVDIDDGVGCTDDRCDEVSDTVVHDANDGSCDNGAYCDGVESCDVNADCQPGVSPTLDDGIPCTDDTCDEDLDRVLNIPNHGSCANGLFCDGNETCHVLRGCEPGTPPLIDDGVGCTDDACDDVNDRIVHQPNDGMCPDDGRFCDEPASCHPTDDCLPGGPRPDGLYSMDGPSGPVPVYCDNRDTVLVTTHDWGDWGQDKMVVMRERASPAVGSSQDWSRTCGLFGATTYQGSYQESGDTYATPGSPAYVDSLDYWDNEALSVFPSATYDDILILQDSITADCWAHYAEAGSLQSFGSPAGGGDAFCLGGESASKPYHIYLCEPQVVRGIQHDRSIATLQASGWSVCYAQTYDQSGAGVSTAAAIRAACGSGGSELLVGCTDDSVDPNNLVVSAADRVDVVLPAADDAADGSDHRVADGNVAWYISEDDSFGFFEGGDGVDRGRADSATGAFPERRLSWHTLSWAGGYRCGATVDLNSDAGWTKYIFAR